MSTDNAELACAVFRAWNAGDADAYAALLSERCLVESRHEPPVRGRAAARRAMQRYRSRCPDLWFDVISIAATDRGALLSWRACGTLRTPAGLGEAGVRVMVSHGCTVLDVADGRVTRLLHYWDADPFRASSAARPPGVPSKRSSE